MTRTLSATPLPIGFGAEVDVDLSRPFDDDEAEELRRLFVRHALLVFRGQKIDLDGQARVMGYLGHVLEGPDGQGYVSNVRPDGTLGTDPLQMHSDVTFSRWPTENVSLNAIDVVDGASGTRFASTARAYARLSDETKARIEGLLALNVLPTTQSSRGRDGDPPVHHPRWVHPVVMRHQTTGEPYLFVNASGTHSILGMDRAESDALLDELFAVLYDEAYIHEHVWYMGDVVIWSNYRIQHGRGDVSAVGNRTLARVTTGHYTFYEQYPEFTTAYKNAS